MRVVGGKFGGLRLAEFKGDKIRPTSDRVKESLFNILGTKVAGARVLDLFCGSGSLGLESLSRGAAEAVFNDVSAESLAVLDKNLKRVKQNINCRVSKLDYAECLSRSGAFDIIFIDPPYASEDGVRALEIIGKSRLLCADGIAVFERDRAFSGEVCGLKLYDERKYGKTYLSFFRSI